MTYEINYASHKNFGILCFVEHALLYTWSKVQESGHVNM